jgi:hypothetical protein
MRFPADAIPDAGDAIAGRCYDRDHRPLAPARSASPPCGLVGAARASPTPPKAASRCRVALHARVPHLGVIESAFGPAFRDLGCEHPRPQRRTWLA